MNLLQCIDCKWCYRRIIGKSEDYLCTWRRFNALARNRYGEEKILTPGRLIRIDKIKVCPLETHKQ